MSFPFDHTQDFLLRSFKVRVLKLSGMGWSIDMERKACKSSIHDHDIDFCVTMAG